ncbi:hypothetical protein SCA6_014833, partial [Theobroma cacao]
MEVNVTDEEWTICKSSQKQVQLLIQLVFKLYQNENMEIYSCGRKFLNVVKPIAVTIFWEACGNGTAVRLRFL